MNLYDDPVQRQRSKSHAEVDKREKNERDKIDSLPGNKKFKVRIRANIDAIIVATSHEEAFLKLIKIISEVKDMEIEKDGCDPEDGYWVCPLSDVNLVQENE